MAEHHDLTEAERAALEWTARDASRGGLLTSDIPDRTCRDEFGEPEPGVGVFRKLVRKGLVWITEEEPLDPEGDPADTFTSTVHLTDAGEVALQAPAPSP